MTLGAGRQRDAVLIYDSCFSGRTGDGAKTLVAGLQATLPVRKSTQSAATTLSSSETFAGPLPGAGRPAFSYVLLGALRGWADANGDNNVSVDEASTYTKSTLRAALRSSERLLSAQGPTNVLLASSTSDEAPNVAAILSGRCPDDARWNGRRCAEVPCPAGTRFNGNVCVATAMGVSCPPGTAWNGTACVASVVACPPGTSWDGTVCSVGAPGAQLTSSASITSGKSGITGHTIAAKQSGALAWVSGGAAALGAAAGVTCGIFAALSYGV